MRDVLDDAVSRENRLRKRLPKMGFRLQRGRTITSKHWLTRHPAPPRGYRITALASGEVVVGQNFDLTLDRVEDFWEKEEDKRIKKKRKEQVAKMREEAAKKRYHQGLQRGTSPNCLYGLCRSQWCTGDTGGVQCAKAIASGCRRSKRQINDVRPGLVLLNALVAHELLQLVLQALNLGSGFTCKGFPLLKGFDLGGDFIDRHCVVLLYSRGFVPLL